MRISDWSSDVCSSDLEPPHRQYVTLWCKTQPFDDCHRIVIARRQAWGAVWNIRHLISLRRKQHCQLACQGRRYSDHAMAQIRAERSPRRKGSLEKDWKGDGSGKDG